MPISLKFFFSCPPFRISFIIKCPLQLASYFITWTIICLPQPTSTEPATNQWLQKMWNNVPGEKLNHFQAYLLLLLDAMRINVLMQSAAGCAGTNERTGWRWDTHMVYIWKLLRQTFSLLDMDRHQTPVLKLWICSAAFSGTFPMPSAAASTESP